MVTHEVPARTPPAEVRLAERLATPRRPPPAKARATAVAALHEIAALDLAIYRAVAETPSPTLDPPMRRLSDAANNSRLWIAIAAALALGGGSDGRRAARVGLLSLAVDSAVVNVGLKVAARRRRPDPDSAGVPELRRVAMPHSPSFPSGHAASGFAFANAVSETLPAAGLPLLLVAAAVGYSRIHGGAHYPSDVILGSLIGGAIGQLVGWGDSHLRQARAHRRRSGRAA